MVECHRKYAGQRSAKNIAVSVTRSHAPIALVLMSYEPVIWQLSVASNSRIVKIILAGYYGQDIQGAPAGVPIEARTYEASLCKSCSRQGDYFYAYKQDSSEFENASRKLLSITGLAPTSFQGTYKADRFSISNETVNSHVYPDSPDDKGDIYTDKTFREDVRVAGQQITLPPGLWQGLAYFEAPSKRGRDIFVAFGRLDNGAVHEVIAVRVQTAGDGNSFPQFSGCSTDPKHAGQVNANDSFGAQLCYEVSHVTDAWSQPLLKMAANKLRASGLTVPDTVVAASFHKADAKRSVDFLLYAIPEARIKNENASWDTSLWHPSRLKPDSDQGRFVEEQVKWAKTWYQIFSLSP